MGPGAVGLVDSEHPGRTGPGRAGTGRAGTGRAGTGQAGTNDDARRTGRYDGRREMLGGGQRHRVVMRNPMNMIPKPIRMFHDPSDGTGRVVFEM